MAAQDDKSIDDEECLYRRVLHRLENFLVYDGNLNQWTLGNASIQFDQDLSVYLSSEMERLNLTIDSILDYPKAAVVFAVKAGGVRAEDFGVERTPIVPPTKPLDSAHGSVWPDPIWDQPELRHRRNNIRRQFTHVAGEITLPKPLD